MVYHLCACINVDKYVTSVAFKNAPSLPPSLTHSLTHSLTQSINQSIIAISGSPWRSAPGILKTNCSLWVARLLFQQWFRILLCLVQLTAWRRIHTHFRCYQMSHRWHQEPFEMNVTNGTKVVHNNPVYNALKSKLWIRNETLTSFMNFHVFLFTLYDEKWNISYCPMSSLRMKFDKF